MTDNPPVRAEGALAPGTEIPRHYPMCIGCGSDHPAGLGLRLWAREGLTVTGTYTVTDLHQGAPGIAHGGVLAAVMDEILGSLNWLLMAPAVTYRLQTTFHRPVPVGATLDLRAEVTEVIDRRVLSKAQASFPQGGKVAVRADAEFRQVPLEHFRAHGNPDYARDPEFARVLPFDSRSEHSVRGRKP